MHLQVPQRQRGLQTLKRHAAGELRIDESVYASEMETADRNLATAHMLRSYGILGTDAHEVVSGYTRQCSILVTVEDLSLMSATLANGGVQPRTRERVLSEGIAQQVMSVMAVAGMYDGAGDWASRVGLPAKSGVGGGIMAVVNRQLGIGVFSPRLDEAGNSVRGKLCCIGLSEALGLHAFDATNQGSSFLSGLAKWS